MLKRMRISVEGVAQLLPAHLCDSTLCHGLAQAYIHIHRSTCSSGKLVLLQELALIGRLSDHVVSVAAHHPWSLWHP